MKHTPGPWHVINYAGFNAIQSEPFYGDTDLLDEGKTENANENAKLAASAPDLLEALEYIASNLQGAIDIAYSPEEAEQTAGKCIEVALEAIKKATS